MHISVTWVGHFKENVTDRDPGSRWGVCFPDWKRVSGRGVKAQCTSVASEPKLLAVLQVPTLSFILRVMFVKGTWGFQGSQDIPMTVLCLLEASSVSFLF